MSDKINNLAERLYNLLEQDKIYWKKYDEKKTKKLGTSEEKLRQIFNDMCNSLLLWRKKSYNKEEIKELINNKDNEVKNLLRIEDYYVDEVYDLASEYFAKNNNVSESDILEESNLNIILNDESVNQKVKDCITIYLDSFSVCDDIYNFLKI